MLSLSPEDCRSPVPWLAGVRINAAGACRTLTANLIEGTSKGFSKELTLIGVGYRAQVRRSRGQGRSVRLLPSSFHEKMPLDSAQPLHAAVYYSFVGLFTLLEASDTDIGADILCVVLHVGLLAHVLGMGSLEDTAMLRFAQTFRLLCSDDRHRPDAQPGIQPPGRHPGAQRHPGPGACGGFPPSSCHHAQPIGQQISASGPPVIRVRTALTPSRTRL